MKLVIFFPADYFNPSKIDEEYKMEYEQACRFPELEIVLYQYDAFVNEGKLILHPVGAEPGPAILRGWMLKPEQYCLFYQKLLESGYQLMNTPEEYEACHSFQNVYPLLESRTPKLYYYPDPEKIEWTFVKQTLDRFMLKDAVKSVKGTKFPAFFDGSYSNEELDGYVREFIAMRGALMTGGITVKEYVELAKRNNMTNEYRVFVFQHEILSISKNSNQPGSFPALPGILAEQVLTLPSHFYTVDWAEKADHSWTIIETGDGQVSGLSPQQPVFQFYCNLAEICMRKQLH